MVAVVVDDVVVARVFDCGCYRCRCSAVDDAVVIKVFAAVVTVVAVVIVVSLMMQ